MPSVPQILIVDDDPMIAMLMGNVLREHGFAVLTATSGESAIAIARSAPPDLVILDKNMPGLPADEVIRALRADRGREHVPVIILSGERIDDTELARLGANASFPKPCAMAALVARIRILAEPP